MKGELNKAERPITARPVGQGFMVPTRGLEHLEGRGRRLPPEAASDNFIAASHGCYRRVPTCRD